MASEPSLTVAWLSADIAYHPVSRFIFGLFSSVSNPKHKHILVDLHDHANESKMHWFNSLNHISTYTVSSNIPQVRINDIVQ